MYLKLTVLFHTLGVCFFWNDENWSKLLLSWQPDGQMDGQTSPFHHTTRNRRHQCTAKMQGLWFLFLPLWCVSGTCARLLLQTGELLLLLSLHTVSEWTFIRNGSCLWERQSAENTPAGRYCTTSCPPTGANYPLTEPAAQGTVKRREEKPECYHLVTSHPVQEFKLLVTFHVCFWNRWQKGWDQKDEPFPASGDVLEILLGFGMLIW